LHQFSSSKLSKLIVNKWQQPIGGAAFAFLDFRNDLSDIGHEKWPVTFWPDRLIVAFPRGNSADGISKDAATADMPANGVSKTFG
jgi:hypothetical protein